LNPAFRANLYFSVAGSHLGGSRQYFQPESDAQQPHHIIVLLMPTSCALNDGCLSLHLVKRANMTPEAALNAQILRYRQMTREQRVLIALRLHEMSCEMARVGIRRQSPSATDSEVESLLRKRLELARTT
jgi:hypothetical protein